MSEDRSEIRVHLAGATLPGKQARWCLTEIPHGFFVLGDVVRGDGSGGMLVRSYLSGALMCWDGRALTELPQERTKAALVLVIPGALEDRPKVRPPPSIPSRRQMGGSRYR